MALVFEGLDTFATVRLNGNVILESNNMFIPYRVDVTADLCPPGAANSLVLDFESALVRGRALREAHPEHRFLASLGGPERLAVRKAQYHWGWDWGPILATAGPWRPVRLETYRSRVEDVSVEYTLSGDLRSCQGTISAQMDGHPGDRVRVGLRSPDGAIVFQHTCKVGNGGLAQAHFTLTNPLLWYARGYGEQHRYHLEAELSVGHAVVHHMTKRVAFRRAELIQEADEHGKSFYFRINGEDVFAGGSCWIPADSFIPRLSPDKYTEWLSLVAEGNQIMIR